MSIRHYVKTSRIAGTSHICLFCQCSYSRLGRSFLKNISTRHYAAAANAVSKLHVNVISDSPEPSATSGSTSFSFNDEKVNNPNKTKTKKPGSGNQSKKKIEKQVREEEIRRKALATLDKSTKFIAAGLDQSGAEPTLSDLDSFKPTSRPPFGLDFVYPEATAFLRPRAPKDSALDEYDVMFEKLVNTLITKFNKKQLVALYKKGIERPVPRGQGQLRPMKKLKTTRDFAAEIVRWRWKWPYLKELADRKTYLTSKAERILHLKTNEFFLFLGPNGSTFQELTDQFGVTLTQVKHAATGFDLLVVGLCYSLDQLAVVLKKRREKIITEVTTPESFSRPSIRHFVYGDSLRRISKHTNALVEELSSGKFQISALDASNIDAAKRLVYRTQQQLIHHPPSFATIGDINAEDYSLFPLDMYRPDRMPLHWNSSTALDISNSDQTIFHTKPPEISSPEVHYSLPSPSIFRIRKILRTFGATLSPQQITDDSGVTELHDNDNKKIYFSVKNILEQPSFFDETRRKQITASFGHIAFTPTRSLRTSLTSPLDSPFSLSQLFEWIRGDTSKIAFIPEIPPSLVKSVVPPRTTSTRLVYRTITPDPEGSSFPVLTFDIKPNRDRPNKNHLAPSSTSFLSSSIRTDSLDISSDLKDIFADEFQGVSGDNSFQYDLELKNEEEPLFSSVQIWNSMESVIDIALPSRPMDIRFSSVESLRVPLSDIPVEMQDYISQYMALRSVSTSPPLSSRLIPLSPMPARPPPLTLQYKQHTYTLDLYASIGSSVYDTPELPVAIEEVTDNESNERSMRCLVNCFDTSNGRDWEAFLNCCDILNRSVAPERVVY